MSEISFTRSILKFVFRHSLVFASLLVGLVGAATAQTTTRPTDGSTPLGIAPGASAGSYALGGFDNVNLFNGNLNFALPLRGIGARGSAGYTMTLAIERHWTVTHQTQIAGCYPSNNCWYSHTFYPTPAWWGGISVGYGPGVLMGRKASDTQCNPGTPNSSGLYNKLTRLTFTMPGGTEYEMIDKLTGGQIINNSNYTCYNYTQTPSRGRVFVTADGSAATFISDTTIYDSNYYEEFYPTGYLMLRDGTRYRVTNGLVDWMRDRNGNKLTFTYDTYKRVTSIKDSINRQVTVSYANLTSTFYDQISFNGSGGTPRTIRIWYSLLGAILKAQNPSVTTPRTYSQLFPELNGASTSTTYNPYLPSSVELPDGRSYQFKYNEYGEMARAVLPTGGAYEYDFAPGRYDTTPSGVVTIGETNKLIFRRIVQRRVYKDGGSTPEDRTTYGRPELYPSGPGYVQVDHFDSNGTTLLARENHYFYGSALNSLITPKPAGYPSWTDGREYKTEALDANGTTVLRRVDHTWEQRAPVSWWTYGASTAPPNDPRITQTVKALEPTGANQVAKQTFNYDQYNNQTDSYEYDYGSGAPAANYTRRTHTDYLTTNSVNGVAYDTVNPNITNPDLVATIHLRGLPTQTQLFGAGSVEKARATYEYDNYASDPPYNFHAALIPRAGISGLCDGSAQNCPNEPNFTDPNYQRRGNLTRGTSWILATSTQLHSHPQYDISGNVVKTIDPGGNATTFAFADCFGIPDGEARTNIAPTALASQSQTSYAFATSGTNALGHISYTQFDYYLGNPVDNEDVNGVVSSRYYDDLLDRPSKMIIAANQGASVKAQRLFTYDDANKTITTRIDQNSFNELNPLKSEILYDGLGRTTETRQYESSTDYIAVRQVPFVVLQDGANWLAASQTSNPFRPHLEQPVWTTSYLDALGQVVKVMTPDNAVVGTAYSGNRVLVTDQAGKQRLSTTNAFGQLKEVWEIKAADSMTNSISFPNHPEVTAGYRTVYEYDTLDNLTKVTQDTDPAQNHQPPRVFVYDSLKRLTLATNPESGTITYSYDNNGNLLTKTDARGVTINYAYDALNRNTAVNYSDATPDILRQYDLAATNGKGRLNKAWQSGTITSATYIDEYDAMGRPLKQRQKFETSGVWSGDYQTQRLYNLAGGVKEQTYPSGRKVFYSYDNAGRTSSFTGNLGDSVNRTYATGINYSVWGGLSREQFGADIPLYHRQHYTNRGQLFDTRVATTDDGSWNRGAIINYYSLTNYGFGNTGTDTNGNVYVQQHWIFSDDQMSAHTVHQQNYAYDSLNRITWVGQYLYGSGITGSQTGAQHFTYDRWGNRKIDPISWGTGINNKQFDVNTANNRLAVPSGQSGVMSYDSAGNLTTDTYSGAGTRSYDAENRMSSAQGGALSGLQYYNYNADGQRVRRKVDGVETWQVYGMDGELQAEYAASAAAISPQKEYGYRNGELLITAANSQGCGLGYTGSKTWTATNPSLGHATGSQEGSNWAVYVGSHSPTAMVFGPYDSTFGQGHHTAQFWLMVDNNSGTDVVATIDVVTNYGSNTLAQRQIRRNEFTAVNQWQVFTLEFNNPCFGLVESRVWWAGSVNMKFSQVTVSASTASAVDIKWLVADHLGTPRMIFDKTGSLANVKRHDYLPFGEELFAGVGGRSTANGYSGDSVRQKFTSKERDNETGLDYFLARYYSNVQGRFTSVDPENYQAMLDLSDPQSWNAYSYVNNDPLDRVDSDGRGFFKKLWNKLRWGVYGEDADVQAEEQYRRQFLYDNSFTKDAQGNWQHVDFSHLSRDELWVAYGAWHDRAADPNTYRLTADELVSALPAGGAAPATGSTANRGPSGRVSTEKYLENNWDKATFGNVKKSIAYHVKQHVTRLGRKMSDVEYTQRALKAFADSAAKKTPTTDKLGRTAVKVVSSEGSGLFTPHGKIIWFQPKF